MLSQFFAMWANAHTKKGASKYKPSDFMLDFSEKPIPTAEDWYRSQEDLFRSLGGKL